MSETNLITEDYRKMQQQLHENPNYGVASVQYAPMVAQVAEALGAREMLDYGAGKGRLGATLKQIMKNPPLIRHYDPAISEWSKAYEGHTPFASDAVTAENLVERIGLTGAS